MMSGSGIHSDADLLAILEQPGLWLIRGATAEVLCMATNLRSALEKAFEYAMVNEAVLAIVKSPSNQLVILPEQIDRLAQHIRFGDKFQRQGARA
jgi:hypothetical protein